MTSGAFAAVTQKGAQEAGAIAVKIAHMDGTASLYMPAPQFVFEDTKPTDRLFVMTMDHQSESEVDQRLSSETRFDPDLWIVEVEQTAGDPMLDVIQLG